MTEVYAYIIEGCNHLPPISIFAEPIQLAWNRNKTFAKVVYNVSDCWRKKKRYYTATEYEHGFELVAYNARDFGFNYLYVVPEESKNLLSCPACLNPVQSKQFIHYGGSCGYPGGCDNMSPDQQELLIKLSTLPASMYIKLWRNKPSDANQQADMIYVIEMI